MKLRTLWLRTMSLMNVFCQSGHSLEISDSRITVYEAITTVHIFLMSLEGIFS